MLRAAVLASVDQRCHQVWWYSAFCSYCTAPVAVAVAAAPPPSRASTGLKLLEHLKQVGIYRSQFEVTAASQLDRAEA